MTALVVDERVLRRPDVINLLNSDFGPVPLWRDSLADCIPGSVVLHGLRLSRCWHVRECAHRPLYRACDAQRSMVAAKLPTGELDQHIDDGLT